jgi:hypothetical protein
MAGATARLMVEILGDSSKAVAAFKQTEGAAKTTEGAAKSTGVSFKGIAAGVATGLAVKKVIDFGRESVKAAEESEVAHKRLVTVFAQAGDASGAAAADAEKYAGSLSKATGVDDEVIMGAQAILATFHSLTGPTAKQADLFDRATAAAADLAAAGFGDLNSNAVQLGKALEDPTKGMTALAKSGVTFTKSQKDQIAALQKSGDLLGAQKIVMGAVEGQVKGTAQATATSSAKMAVAWGNFQESVGAALLPFISTIQDKLSGLFAFVSANSSWLVPLVTGIALLIGTLLVAVKTIALIQKAVQAFTLVWRVLNLAFAASPIGFIIVAVVALIAVIVLIATKTDWFQRIWAAMTKFLASAWNATVGAIIAAWNAVYNVLASGFNAVRNIVAGVLGWIRANWPLLLGILTGPFGLAVAMIFRFWGPISGFFSGIVSSIAGVFSGVVHAITQPFITAFNIVKGVVDAAVGAIRGAVSSVLSFVNSGIQGAKNVYNAFARTWNAIEVGFPGIDKGPIHIGGFTVGLPDLPMLARGGLITRGGLAYVHAAEVVSPAPATGRSGPAVVIESATFSEAVDVEVLLRKVAWAMQTQRI